MYSCYMIAISSTGLLYVAGFTGFFAYLSKCFKGPEEPKFLVDPELANMAKNTQPGIVPEYYYRPNKNN